MTSLKDNIKSLLKKHNIQPSKGLGQNFLIDGSAINKVLSAIDFKSNNTVIEVGPGFGILTGKLVEKAKKVIAVEKDPNMVKLLKEESSSIDNLEIINSDILKWEPKDTNYTLVGNIPFYLTAPVIRKFLEYKNRPKQIVFIIQKEVAQRICAKPPSSRKKNLSFVPSLPEALAEGKDEILTSSPSLGKMNILAVSVQLYAEPKIISYIKKDSFWPRPKIDSAIIKITPLGKLGLAKEEIDLFFKIVKAGFSQPRKQLANNLTKKLNLDRVKAKKWLEENNIQTNQRAETLRVEDWINLTKSFKMN